MHLGYLYPQRRRPVWKKDNHELKEVNKLLRTECFNFQTAAQKYRHDGLRFYQEDRRPQETLEAMSLEIKRVTEIYNRATSLSETHGKELTGAHVFLPEADGLSISELIQRVDGLNDEIYEAAASLGECWANVLFRK